MTPDDDSPDLVLIYFWKAVRSDITDKAEFYLLSTERDVTTLQSTNS